MVRHCTTDALEQLASALRDMALDFEPRQEMRIAQEEVFGPFVTILPVKDYDEAIRVANSTIYGPSCAIFTENARTAFRAMRDINSGLVYINAGTTGAESHLPFGGTKQSGNRHRELGRKAVEEFSEIKTVYLTLRAGRGPAGSQATHAAIRYVGA
jgi:aldehyde dehydrogenase (NAD+)